MEKVLIVIHLIIVLALVGVVLLQRSEGGGLGIGGGSGFMTARGAANALTRATAILAAAFFATSLLLSILARYGERPTDILQQVPATQGEQKPAGGQGGGVLTSLADAREAVRLRLPRLQSRQHRPRRRPRMLRLRRHRHLQLLPNRRNLRRQPCRNRADRPFGIVVNSH